MSTSPLILSFRRALVDNKLRDWLSLVAQISHVELTHGSYYFKWSLNRSDLYTVQSLYQHLIDTQPPFHHRKIWKMRIPLKIKFFLWFLQREVVLTKDNLKCSAVIGMRLSNTSSLTVPLLKRFGKSSFLQLIWTNLGLSTICLVLGWIINLKRWKVWSGSVQLHCVGLFGAAMM
jgi:hypothetical protein